MQDPQCLFTAYLKLTSNPTVTTQSRSSTETKLATESYHRITNQYHPSSPESAMFDRIRRAIICLTTSDDIEVRNKLDGVTVRRATKEGFKVERRYEIQQEKAKRIREKERRRQHKAASKLLKERWLGEYYQESQDLRDLPIELWMVPAFKRNDAQVPSTSPLYRV